MRISEKTMGILRALVVMAWSGVATGSFAASSGLPGAAVQAESAVPGEYWLQVVASSKPLGTLNVLSIFPEGQQVVHRDAKGMNRLLVGPFGRYRSALFARDYLRRQGVDDAFVRFVPAAR